MDHHPGPAVAALMKLSFDEEHRHAICSLGKTYTYTGTLMISISRHSKLIIYKYTRKFIILISRHNQDVLFIQWNSHNCYAILTSIHDDTYYVCKFKCMPMNIHDNVCLMLWIFMM